MTKLTGNNHITNTVYSVWQIRLHWMVACLIPLLLFANQDIKSDWQIVSNNITEIKNISLGSWFHILGGVSVLIFMLWRLSLRVLNKTSKYAPSSKYKYLNFGKNLIIFLIYFCTILSGVTGLLGWFFNIAFTMEIHGSLSQIVLGLVLVHIVGIMFYEGVLGQKLIVRMTSGIKKRTT